jgi:hypothetical protein
MFSFYVSTSELNIFSIDLLKIDMLLLLKVFVHSFLQLTELHLHLLCVLIVDFFELFFLQSFAYVYQELGFFSIICLLIFRPAFDVFFYPRHYDFLRWKTENRRIFNVLSIGDELRHKYFLPYNK